MYIFINKNYLVPIVKYYENRIDALNKLQNETIFRNNDNFTNNIYILNEYDEQTILYFSDGKVIYKKNINSQELVIFYKYNTSFFMNTNYVLSWTEKQIQENNDDMKISFETKQTTNNILVDNGNIENISLKLSNNYSNNNLNEIKNENENENVNEIKNENVNENVNEKEFNIEYIKKKEEIIKMIEEVNELYQKELSNIKKLELNIKSYDLKIAKLEKKKKDDIISEIVRTQSEYRTWKKIKYIIEDDDNEQTILKPLEELTESHNIIPILFQSKYDYLDKIQTNESIKNLLNEINLINLNELYSENNLIDDKIIKFCKKYMNLSKELHYTFDHEWDYLENEMNVSSTNRL